MFTLRLPQETQDTIAAIAEVYGAPSPRAFAREILETIMSGDEGKIREFLERLGAKIQAQMALNLRTPLPPVLPVQDRKKAPKRGRGAKRHAGAS